MPWATLAQALQVLPTRTAQTTWALCPNPPATPQGLEPRICREATSAGNLALDLGKGPVKILQALPRATVVRGPRAWTELGQGRDTVPH